MAKSIIWATAVMLCIASVSWASSFYWQEEMKQISTMYQACLNKGGEWKPRWLNSYNCEFRTK